MKLRPYQQEAVAAVIAYWERGGLHPLIEIPTGGGKSAVLGELARFIVQDCGGRVVVATHRSELIDQDSAAIRRVWPEAPLAIWSASLNKRGVAAITVCGVQTVAKRAKELGNVAVLIVDEAHLIPPDGDGQYQTLVKGLRAINPGLRIVGLTATPIYNYGDEIFTVVEYIAPGCLGSREEFHTNWCRNQGTHWVVRDPEALGAYLQGEGIALRRTEEDPEVAQVLPPLRRALFQVAWNEGDVETDRELQRRLAQRVLTGSFTQRGQAARELDLLLRQETGIAKARAVAAYVRNLVAAGEQVILGGWHREVYRIWTEALSDLRVVMFTGSETQPQKRAARQAILDGAADVIIISLRSGAGLDGLQDRIAHVVFGELDWSPEVHKQLVGRARRRGQTREVTAHYLWTDGGSDPVLMSLLGLKASQAHGILNPYAGGVQRAPEMDEGRMRALAARVLKALPAPGPEAGDGPILFDPDAA